MEPLRAGGGDTDLSSGTEMTQGLSQGYGNTAMASPEGWRWHRDPSAGDWGHLRCHRYHQDQAGTSPEGWRCGRNLLGLTGIGDRHLQGDRDTTETFSRWWESHGDVTKGMETLPKVPQDSEDRG